MKATELRIGNWIHSSSKTNWGDTWDFDCRVTQIYDDRFGAIQYTHHGSGIVYSDDAEIEFTGIPLTKEWLLRFGFSDVSAPNEWLCIKIEDNSELCFSLMEDSVTDQVGIYKKEDWKGNGGWFYLDCKYVHQLQNLYFALTGEELILKETV